MQSPEYRTEIVGNHPSASSSVTSIGPWPIKCVNSKVAASIPANELKDPGPSFSQVMAQIDEAYVITMEMEVSEERAINVPPKRKRFCDFLLTFLHLPTVILVASSPIFASLMTRYLFVLTMDLINVRWPDYCEIVLYFLTFLAFPVSAVLGMTPVLIFRIWSPDAVPSTCLELCFSICAGTVLAVLGFYWMWVVER